MKKVISFSVFNGSFAVRCNSWHLYNAFAEELNAIGYECKCDIIPWNVESFNIPAVNCIYISNNWNGKSTGLMYSFSHTDGDVFDLTTEWTDALVYAKECYKSTKEETLELTSINTAKIDRENEFVEVGCQKIPFDKVNELYMLINKI